MNSRLVVPRRSPPICCNRRSNARRFGSRVSGSCSARRRSCCSRRAVRALKASGDRRVSGESQLPRGLSRTTYDYVAKLHALACLLARTPDARVVLAARPVPGVGGVAGKVAAGSGTVRVFADGSAGSAAAPLPGILSF